MKKMIAAAAMLCLLSLAMAACDGMPTVTTTTATEQPAATATTQPTEQPTEQPAADAAQ